MPPQDEHPQTHGPRRIDVAVITTSGAWPQTGFESVPANQPVKVQLHEAARKLNLSDVSTWVAKVGTKELDVNQDYLANGLSGQIEIDYGPREGGGGHE